MRIRSPLAKAGLAALALAFVAPFARGEDLMKAYYQALANDPVLAQQAAQRDISQAGVGIARAPLLPQLSAGLTFQQTHSGSGQFTNASGNPALASNRGYARSRDLSVGLSQTILDFGKHADLNAAEASAKGARAQYQAALQNLIVRVTSAYFDVLLAKDQVANSMALEKQLARQLDRAQALFDNGLTAITDVQDAKAQHDSALAQLIRARNQLDDAREALAVITGKPVQGLKVLSDKLPMSPPRPNTLQTWVTRARDGNPAIVAQQYAVTSAEHSIDAARDERLPTLSASVRYGDSATWYEHGPGRDTPDNTTIGLTLSVPIFSGGGIHARISQSISQRDLAQATLTQQRRTVVRQTRDHFRSVNAGISEVEATRQAVVSAKSALQATEAGFNVGTRTIVDVLLAQHNLAQARQQYSQARHTFILNKLLLEQDAGSLDVADLKAVNALLVSASSPDAVANSLLDGKSGNASGQ